MKQKNRLNSNRIRRIAVTSILLLAIMGALTACGKKSEERVPAETGFVPATPGVYDSADTAVVTKLDAEQKQITLKNPEVERCYTLTYDGTTCFYDKYGNVLSAMQISPGEVVDLTFMRSAKRLNTLQRNAQAWTIENHTNWILNEENSQISIGDDKYLLGSGVPVFSDGEEAALMDLQSIDGLTIRGMGMEVYSIVVSKGHGYLRLKNDTYFYGGFIEVGNSVVRRVDENMLLVVPEGEHQVLISNKGTSGVRTIEVKRNMETVLDLGDIKIEEPKYGEVLFSIEPAGAILYLDGDMQEYEAPISLEYGIHQMILMAPGYSTITQYLKVGQEFAGIDVAMEPDFSISGNDIPELAEPSEALEETPIGVEETTGTLNHYVTIHKPEEVEVYVDGNYIGITPCSFKKTAGTSVITLRKTGYVSKSYTLQIDGEEENISYSFLDLEKIP